MFTAPRLREAPVGVERQRCQWGCRRHGCPTHSPIRKMTLRFSPRTAAPSPRERLSRHGLPAGPRPPRRIPGRLRRDARAPRGLVLRAWPTGGKGRAGGITVSPWTRGLAYARLPTRNSQVVRERKSSRRLLSLHVLTGWELPGLSWGRAVTHARLYWSCRISGRVTGTMVIKLSRPLKSSGFVVKRGSSSAAAMAAIIRSATRRRGFRPAETMAAQILP